MGALDAAAAGAGAPPAAGSFQSLGLLVGRREATAPPAGSAGPLVEPLAAMSEAIEVVPPPLPLQGTLASACLPLLFKAVEIDGEHYWDGGYSGNPALHPLIYQTDTSDILLVQINPIEHRALPDSGPEIMERMNEVTFNASLLAELRAIEFVRRLLAEGKLDARRYKSVRMHRIDGGAALAAFGADSKLRADLAFVRKLFALGRETGQAWLAAHGKDVGVRPSIRIADNA